MICEVCKKKIKDKFFITIHEKHGDKFMHIKCLKKLDNVAPTVCRSLNKIKIK